MADLKPKRYAIVEDGFVINMVMWDGKAEWEPSSGKAVKATDDAQIGWTYDGKTFKAPEGSEG